MRRRKGKKRTQMAHAKWRALGRYDFELTEEVHDNLRKKVYDGRATLVEKQSNRVSVFDVQHEGKKIRMVYDRQRRQIVTFLPINEEPKGESA